ncbi:hypothetical protein [Amycolatopsis sp. cg13]|uniref:phosphotransferase-like protein n=1 Tax=Amycolatopsis sp. cg13 TaxID=3238807 RepID=UPI003524075D
MRLTPSELAELNERTTALFSEFGAKSAADPSAERKPVFVFGRGFRAEPRAGCRAPSLVDWTGLRGWVCRASAAAGGAVFAEIRVCSVPAPNAGIEFAPDGQVIVGPEFRTRVLWVGVRCDSAIAAGREVARDDRVAAHVG